MKDLTGEDRRNWLKENLKGTSPITGHDLSQSLGVSRQIIVQDIALLRAEGYPIISTPRGYMFWTQPTGSIRAVIAVKHADSPEVVEAELLTMVHAGVSVVNVIVAHPLYGELVGNLNVSTAEDVARFVHNMQELDATLLSRLTDGVHLHTIEGSPREIDRARRALNDGGFLLKST